MRTVLLGLIVALAAPLAAGQARTSAPSIGRIPPALSVPRSTGPTSGLALPAGAGSTVRTPLGSVRTGGGAAARIAPDTPITEALLAWAAPTQVRQLQVQRLLQRFGEHVDLDLRGEPVLRREFLVVDPDASTLDAVARAGFTARRVEIADVDMRIVVLEDTLSRGARQAMEALEKAAPDAEFAYQHVYLPSAPTAAVPLVRAEASDGVRLRVGLVDGGVDAAHAALSGMRVHRHGCGGRSLPQAHGTTVAVRLAGGGRGDLFAADLWCGDGPGQATLGLVQALAWMSRERVPVVNISLVGPANAVLARAVKAMQARGHVLVAAVGNDGPAAPPLYPAAYGGVIGVAAVDARFRVLPESGSGAHVDFVAPGVIAGGRRPLRGTSFAAPLVSRSLARLMAEPQPAAAARAVEALERQARDLGQPGHDPRYGRGLIAAHF